MHKTVFNSLKYLKPNGLKTKRESDFYMKQLIFKYNFKLPFTGIIPLPVVATIHRMCHSFIHAFIYLYSRYFSNTTTCHSLCQYLWI